MSVDSKKRPTTARTARVSRGRARIKKAEASYKKIMQEVEPFIRKRKTSQHSTAGKWQVLGHET